MVCKKLFSYFGWILRKICPLIVNFPKKVLLQNRVVGRLSSNKSKSFFVLKSKKEKYRRQIKYYSQYNMSKSI